MVPLARRNLRRMVEEFGMSEALGPLALTRPPMFLPLDGTRWEPTPEAGREIRRLLEEAEDRASAILQERRSDLDRLAVLLLERETLDRAELEAALVARGPDEPARRGRASGVEITARGGRP